MKRGDIWTAAGAVYASKPRPCLIVQDDLFLMQPGLNSVTVIPFSGAEEAEDVSAVRLLVTPDDVNGLSRPCALMVDKITTTQRTKVRQHIGRLDARQMAQISALVATFLGLGRGAGRVRRP